jgi:hypothetical protein
VTHLSDHNDLAAALQVEAARYMTTIDMGGPFNLGDPAGVNEHNRVAIAMIHLRDVANGLDVDPVVSLTLPDEAHVGDTGHGTSPSTGDHGLLNAALAVLQAVVLPWEA